MGTEILIQEIIKEQSYIIGGNLAKSMALSTGAIEMSDGVVKLVKQDDQALKDIILAYEKLFGEVSVKVCFSVIERHKDQTTNQMRDRLKQLISI